MDAFLFLRHVRSYHFSVALTVSALAIENGPGPQVGSSYSAGRSTSPSILAAATPGN